jgi:hypothetical protein
MSVPTLMFVPAQPVNLMEVLEAQARCLIAGKVPQEVGVSEDKFLDDAMAFATEFVYSVELAAIQLDRVWLMHYGVRDRHLVEMGGVNLYTDPDKFTLFEEVTVPNGLCVVQGQLGPKYKNRKPRDIRTQHDPLEQLGVPKEGLTAFLYWGKDLLRESWMDFSGAVSEYGYVPYLYLHGGEPALYNRSGDNPYPYFGSVSVSRG